jgi:iron(III) transport system substrate-binding protein
VSANPNHRRSYSRARVSWLSAGLVGLTLLVACSFTGIAPTPTPVVPPTAAPRPTAEPPASVSTWYQAAQSEAPVRVRADLTGSEVDALTRLLARRYPQVSVEWQRGPDVALLQQSLREARDGSLGWDVYVGDSAPSLKSARQALRWTPPEARSVSADLFDSEGAWYALAASYHVIQYNSEQVRQPGSLTTYEALLDPRFFGRLAIEDDDLTWLRGLIETRGRDGAIQLIKALAQQSVTFRNDQRSLVVFVTAGQHASAVDARMEAVERERRGGGKTAWVGVDPIIVQPLAMVVSETTDRPNAARLVANFLLSPDAQVVLAEGGRVPARSDVEPDPPTLIQGLHPYVVLPPEGAAERDLHELWRELWGRR